MARFSLSAVTLALSLSSTNAFVTSPKQHSFLLSPMKMSSTAAQPEIPLSPLTLWGEKISDIRQIQSAYRSDKTPDFAPTVNAKELNLSSPAEELQYFKDNAESLKRKMVENGAVILRGFESTKTSDGFQAFYNAIGMKVCLDPLHSVSARPTVDGKKGSPVYEAVNKESRKNFFIGMHNEFVGTRAPRAAAFVCFKAAETGGEFLVGDGRAIFRDLDPALVEKLYNRSIRYSVMELPFFGWIDSLPDFIQSPAMGAVQGLASAAINAKVDFSVELLWGEGGYDNVKMLQARAPSQPPIVLHPVTGDPTWFCNVHSHSSQLRKERESVYGAERFEDGASQINKSDMFFGDDAEISLDELKQMDEVTMKNVQYVKMTEGDVVLLDNYKCMHGRNVFDGTRKHGVAWFEGWTGEEEMKKEFLTKTEKVMA